MQVSPNGVETTEVFKVRVLMTGLGQSFFSYFRNIF